MNNIGIFDEIERFSSILDTEDMLEARIENDVSGNPIYIGYSMIPNADPALKVWYVIKLEYVTNFVVRRRLPKDGRGFFYSYNDRATLFP
jgi:hypothetical protein